MNATCCLLLNWRAFYGTFQQPSSICVIISITIVTTTIILCTNTFPMAVGSGLIKVSNLHLFAIVNFVSTPTIAIINCSVYSEPAKFRYILLNTAMTSVISQTQVRRAHLDKGGKGIRGRIEARRYFVAVFVVAIYSHRRRPRWQRKEMHRPSEDAADATSGSNYIEISKHIHETQHYSSTSPRLRYILRAIRGNQ